MALTTAQLFGLIITVVIIILIVLVIVNPALMFGEWGRQQTSFRDFCIQWSLRNYAENLGEPVFRPYPPTQASTNYGAPEDYCGPVIGKPLGGLNQDDIENCKDVCRLKK